MNNQKAVIGRKQCSLKTSRLELCGRLAVSLLAVALAPTARATENVPHLPFAQWADVPQAKQFIVGLIYSESEAYHIFANRDQHNVTWKAGGESYGIDVNQGFVAVQYGLTEKWALDLSAGATTVGWRYFADMNGKPGTQGSVRSTTGIMDISFGARYQIFNEAEADSPWIPTLTFRAGAVMPGTYDKDFGFAPGLRSAAIEPEFLARKHFGWPGLGAFFDGLYRWNKTTGTDQYITDIGLFQQIKGWELDVGYRHLQTLSGEDIILDAAGNLTYPRSPREINDAIEAGFSYTTSKKHIRWGFETRTVVDGSNTDTKFWVGGSVQIPFGGSAKSD
jgi:hypothetical protein